MMDDFFLQFHDEFSQGELSRAWCPYIPTASSSVEWHSSAEKTIEGRNEDIGPLDVRQVAAVRDEFERTLLKARNRLLRLGLRENPIKRTPDDERWHL